MTTLPAYLPGLMRGALEAGASITVRQDRNAIGTRIIQLYISWADGGTTIAEWALRDGWTYVGDNVPLRDIRARIKREAQR